LGPEEGSARVGGRTGGADWSGWVLGSGRAISRGRVRPGPAPSQSRPLQVSSTSDAVWPRDYSGNAGRRPDDRCGFWSSGRHTRGGGRCLRLGWAANRFGPALGGGRMQWGTFFVPGGANIGKCFFFSFFWGGPPQVALPNPSTKNIFYVPQAGVAPGRFFFFFFFKSRNRRTQLIQVAFNDPRGRDSGGKPGGWGDQCPRGRAGGGRAAGRPGMHFDYRAMFPRLWGWWRPMRRRSTGNPWTGISIPLYGG